jgi:hypothetical protein
VSSRWSSTLRMAVLGLSAAGALVLLARTLLLG